MGVVVEHGHQSRRSTAEQGISLVEMLVAFTILLISIIGILPMFMRSIMNNHAGNSYTRLSHSGRSQVEELFQLDFDDPRLQIPAGQTEASIEQYWSAEEEIWKDGVPPAGTYPWTRRTTVRQYGIDAVDTTLSSLDFNHAGALDGGLVNEFVHLKEITVEVMSQGAGSLGPRRDLVLRTLKAK